MSKAWEGGSDTRWRRFRLAILGRDKYRCQLQLKPCTEQATEVDHIVPLARGGAKYDPANCRAACKPCNLVRGDREPVPQPVALPASMW